MTDLEVVLIFLMSFCVFYMTIITTLHIKIHGAYEKLNNNTWVERNLRQDAVSKAERRDRELEALSLLITKRNDSLSQAEAKRMQILGILDGLPIESIAKKNKKK